MDTDYILQSHEERIRSLEEASRKHEGLILAAEDKASGAWKTIAKVQDDLGDLYDKVDELDQNVKTIMASQSNIDKSLEKVDTMASKINEDNVVAKSQQKVSGFLLKILLILVAILVLFNVIFFVYVWTHDPELAREMLSFGKTAVQAVT